MNITPLGAAGGEVTGSAYLLETPRARLLVDCGLFQGGQNAARRNRALFPRVGKLDAVLLTHAHLDHTGRLPLLPRQQYDGPVYATPASVELTALILRDSAKIQAQDLERQNRRRERAGQPPEQALYTPVDAENLIRLLKPVPYREPVVVAPGVEAVWSEAGHMLGSASIQLRIADGDRPRTVVFSGDLGPRTAPILKEFEPFRKADLVFLESTYGDHDHRPFGETVDEFVRIVQAATRSGGKVLVPTFAVGRAQLLSMLLSWMFRQRLVDPFPVYLDSPMAIQAWEIYRHHHELFDEDMIRFIPEGSVEEVLRTLKATVTADESKAINQQAGPALIMAGAGMCSAGRILHHLKNHLWKPDTHVIIVGYQATGSLGRMLIEGAESVNILGEKIAVRATIHTLGGFSAHAGQTDLLAWFSALAPAQPRVALTHGEDEPRRVLAGQLLERFGVKAALPNLGEVIEL
jgi:metallo-beta-lactamase family protein